MHHLLSVAYDSTGDFIYEIDVSNMAYHFKQWVKTECNKEKKALDVESLLDDLSDQIRLNPIEFDWI